MVVAADTDDLALSLALRVVSLCRRLVGLVVAVEVGHDGRRLAVVVGRRLRLHQPHLLADPVELRRDLLLDQAEAHRQDGHPEQHVDSGAHHLPLVGGVLEVRRARHHVAEPDGGDGDEAEVGRLQRVPTLPNPEQQRAEENVPADDRHRDGQRHADLRLVVVFVVVVVVAHVVDEHRGRLLRLVRVLPRLGRLTARAERRYRLDAVARPAAAAAAAAELGVDEAEDVGEDGPEVGETEQHERDTERGVRDAHQPAPEGLRRDVAVTCQTHGRRQAYRLGGGKQTLALRGRTVVRVGRRK